MDHTSTRLYPIHVGAVLVHVDVIVGLLANIVPWVQLGIVGHSAGSGSVGVGAVDKVIAIRVAYVQPGGTRGR
jgi:hypothetical protein